MEQIRSLLGQVLLFFLRKFGKPWGILPITTSLFAFVLLLQGALEQRHLKFRQVVGGRPDHRGGPPAGSVQGFAQVPGYALAHPIEVADLAFCQRIALKRQLHAAMKAGDEIALAVVIFNQLIDPVQLRAVLIDPRGGGEPALATLWRRCRFCGRRCRIVLPRPNGRPLQWPVPKCLPRQWCRQPGPRK